MKRKRITVYFILAISIFLTVPLPAANSWIPLETPEGYQSFRHIDNVGSDLVWAIYTPGTAFTSELIKSSDGGKSWTDQYVFSTSINDLEFIDENTGFVIQSGTIYKTEDGGDSWTEIYSNMSLSQLEIISENSIWAAASSKYIIHTEDGGNVWETDTITTMSRNILDISAIDNNRIWVIQEDPYSTSNILYTTTNGGESWSQKSYQEIIDVEMTAADVGYAFYNGRIYKTTNNGDSWSISKMMSSDYNLYALDSEHCWAYPTANGIIYKTGDGGNTWENSGSGYGFSIYMPFDFCAIDTSLAWMGDRYRISKYVPYPELELLYPNAGDDVNAGESVQISWEAQTIDYINIYYTLNGNDWFLIDDSVETAPGRYYWQTPTSAASQCKIKLEPSRDLFSHITTESDGYFSIVIPPIAFREFDLYEECDFSETNPLNVFAKEMPIRLKVKVKNNQSQNLLSASGILSTDNQYISLSDNSSSYNNILVGSEEWSSNEFEFTIANNAPDEFTVDFELDVNDQIVTGGPWTCQFSLPIVLDPFEVGLVLIDDDNNPDSQGDNDDIVEPGEHVEIIPLLNNVSNNEYDKVEGELIALLDEIDIWDVRSGASGVVYAHYPYNVVSGDQETVTALQSNIMPEQDFVLTYNFTGTYSFPLLMQISADVPKYNDMEMRWAQEFIINSTYPVGIDGSIPENYSLSHYPNPFNPSAVISYQLPYSDRIDLSIYDLRGQKVRTLINGFQDAGHYSVNFNAADLPGGVYLYRLVAGNEVVTKKMVLMK